MFLIVELDVEDIDSAKRDVQRLTESTTASSSPVPAPETETPIETSSTAQMTEQDVQPSNVEEKHNGEPILGTGSMKFGDKKAKEMKPSEFVAFGDEGITYLRWLLQKLEESVDDSLSQKSPKHEENLELISWIQNALDQA